MDTEDRHKHAHIYECNDLKLLSTNLSLDNPSKGFTSMRTELFQEWR